MVFEKEEHLKDKASNSKVSQSISRESKCALGLLSKYPNTHTIVLFGAIKLKVHTIKTGPKWTKKFSAKKTICNLSCLGSWHN